jgi:hypothetical protein
MYFVTVFDCLIACEWTKGALGAIGCCFVGTFGHTGRRPAAGRTLASRRGVSRPYGRLGGWPVGCQGDGEARQARLAAADRSGFMHGQAHAPARVYCIMPMTVQCRPSKAHDLMRVSGRSDCAGAGRRRARGFDRDPVDGLVVGGGGQPGAGGGGTPSAGHRWTAVANASAAASSTSITGMAAPRSSDRRPSTPRRRA